jgi:Family of unknown function (DUF5977)
MKNLILLTIASLLLFFSSCKKEIKVETPSRTTQTSSIPPGYMMTPGGLRPIANVHLIEKGYKLALQNGHAYKMHATSGAVLEDFGAIKPLSARLPRTNVLQDTTKLASVPSGGLDGGNWVAFAQWYNTSGEPIVYFSTNWTVPANPTGNNGTLEELIYIWDGLSTGPSSYPLIQPVLQYGPNNKFGGSNWSLSNWCVWDNGAAYTDPVLNVAVGTPLQGIMTLTGIEGDGSHDYVCSFNGQPNPMTVIEGRVYLDADNPAPGAQVALPAIPELNYAFEVLEVPNYIGNAAEYPNQAYVSMGNINFLTGLTVPSNYPTIIPWTTPNCPGAKMSEHTQNLDNYSTGGIVSLCFGATNEFLNVQASKVFAKNNCTSGSGSMLTYTVYANSYNATSQAAADALAQNDINTNGQNFANRNGVCNVGNDVQVYAGGLNVSQGAMPGVSFEVPGTGQIVVSATITSSLGNMYVPSASYTVVMTQPNNRSFTANIPGYGSQTGQTLTFYNVVVSGGMSIYVTDH